jgi:hypothetical protein
MTSAGQTTSTTSIGAALSGERQRLRISMDAVERGTMIRRGFLEKIDRDQLDDLPPGAYAKGFIRSYAVFLGLDPAPFVKAYDDLYAAPEPELAAVVQKGVREPPDRSRRAWKIAVGAAITMLVVLGLLGVFGSDGKPEEIPQVSAAVARSEAQAPSNALGAIVLRVDVVGDATWVEAEADGQPVFGETLERGDFRTFKADDQIVLYAARAGEIRVTANGKILGAPGTASYKGVFTPATVELPANELEATASEAPAPAESAEAPAPAGNQVYLPESDGQQVLSD